MDWEVVGSQKEEEGKLFLGQSGKRQPLGWIIKNCFLWSWPRVGPSLVATIPVSFCFFPLLSCPQKQDVYGTRRPRVGRLGTILTLSVENPRTTCTGAARGSLSTAAESRSIWRAFQSHLGPESFCSQCRPNLFPVQVLLKCFSLLLKLVQVKIFL